MNLEDMIPVRIDKTTIGNVTVSTIKCFSGFSNSHVAETMLFLEDGKMPAGLKDQDGERCSLEKAQDQHDKWVAKVKEARAKK